MKKTIILALMFLLVVSSLVSARQLVTFGELRPIENKQPAELSFGVVGMQKVNFGNLKTIENAEIKSICTSDNCEFPSLRQIINPKKKGLCTLDNCEFPSLRYIHQ